LKKYLSQLLENVCGPWKKRILRGLVVLTTAIFIGGFGAWLIESSRWLGVPGSDARELPSETQAYRFLVRMPSTAFAEGLARASFDFPQMCRPTRPTPEICILFMDEDSSRELKQGSTYDRRVHAELLRVLKAEGARAVFFDIVFSGERDDPDSPADLELAAALKDFGAAFIGGGIEQSFRDKSNNVKIVTPKPIFRRAGAQWGLLVFQPIDSDYGIRAMYPGTDQIPSLSWRAAEKLGAKLPADNEERKKLRWLNYYGRTGTFQSYSYFEVLNPNGRVDENGVKARGVKEGAFKDKIVFVGGKTALAVLNFGKDDFRTPYTALPGGQFAPGVEVHATAMLNLLRGEWLTRLPIEKEKRIVFWFGFIFTILLMPRAPWQVLSSCVALAIAVTLLAIWGVQHSFVWGNWLVPALVIPLLIALANYLFEGRRRNAIIGAFGKYLSPEMAKQISTQDVDLKPGGKVVEGTIMFTDLEGFTSLSEELDDPARLSQILATYFTQCTGHVLELKGTIAKFIGDAVLAVWGAPLPDKDQVRNAVVSAWRLHKDSDIMIDGKPLLVRGKKVRTRIGIHTGQVLAGNLGSEQRFDWTVIGDPVNLAARLESLNKHLGTSVLISNDAFEKMGPGFTTRRLGAFIMKGKASALVIHEMLGEAGIDPVPEWLPDFNAGVAAFEAGDVNGAKAAFENVIAARGGKDGPSEFLLGEIERRTAEPSAEWSAEVELHEK
jgi:adenylate cyclase